ncbi:hypothetical protein [Actinomadura madurae]|uniref:hypothetical protein n=1 Tax=Actinomadura madurae TaxID=1993 RepID=UPI0026E52283|nr:hypothetical protein [Actinomadura madurae]
MSALMRSSRGAGPAVGHHGGGVVVEARERLGGPGEQGGIVAAGQRPEHVVGPGQQRLAVARREPEGVADHDQRELGGQVGDEVAFAALADPVDDLVAEPFEVGPPAGDPPRGEPGADQPAAQLVLGIVHVDHHRQRAVVGADALAVAEQPGMPGDVLGRRVGRDPPDLAVGVPVDGRVVPDPAELGVGVAAPELTADQVDRVVDRLVGPGCGRGAHGRFPSSGGPCVDGSEADVAPHRPPGCRAGIRAYDST